MRSRVLTRFLSVAVVGVAALAVTAGTAGRVPATAAAPPRVAAVAAWPMAGHDIADSHDNPLESTIGVGNVSQLAKKWSMSFSSTLAATPTVSGGIVYVSDYNGEVYAINAATGSLKWSHAVSSWTGLAKDLVRASPVVYGADLIIVDRPIDVAAAKRNGTHMIAVNASTGALVWQTIIDPQKPSTGTGAPTIDGNIAYQGMSSDQELASTCCTFRGDVVAVNLKTHKVLWRTYSAPSGYTGDAVWGSSPAVDHTTGLLYVGTGNNYTVPSGVCTQPGQSSCSPVAADDYVDSVLALSTKTGAVVWAFRTLASDEYSHSCTSAATCGPDFDFGSDPNLFTVGSGSSATTLVGDGQKTGIYYALDAATGQLVWSVQEGPDGKSGGILWGSAVDGSRIYSAVANAQHLSWQLQPAGGTTSGGFFSAVNPATGAILWQTPDPQGNRAQSFMSVANGVAYGGTSSGTGDNMFAMNAATGAILWSYAGGGSIMGGAAVVDGVVYWEAGYYSKDCPSSMPSCGNTKHALRVRRPHRVNPDGDQLLGACGAGGRAGAGLPGCNLGRATARDLVADAVHGDPGEDARHCR